MLKVRFKKLTLLQLFVVIVSCVPNRSEDESMGSNSPPELLTSNSAIRESSLVSEYISETSSRSKIPSSSEIPCEPGVYLARIRFGGAISKMMTRKHEVYPINLGGGSWKLIADPYDHGLVNQLVSVTA